MNWLRHVLIATVVMLLAMVLYQYVRNQQPRHKPDKMGTSRCLRTFYECRQLHDQDECSNDFHACLDKL